MSIGTLRPGGPSLCVPLSRACHLTGSQQCEPAVLHLAPRWRKLQGLPSHSPKFGTRMARLVSKNETGWFEVRRDPRGRGVFQWERVGLRGQWSLVGSLAAEAMWRFARSSVVARMLAVGPERRQEGGRVGEGQGPSGAIKVHAWMSPRDVATIWRAALDAVTGRTRPLAPEMWSRLAFPFWAQFVPALPTPEGLVLPFYLPLNPQAAAIALSAAFGMAAGRLQVCPCGRPFVRSLVKSSQRACDHCRRSGAVPVAGLPPALASLWVRLRKRLAYEVRSGKITPDARSGRQLAAHKALLEVAAGRLALDEWRRMFGPRTRRGRKPSRALASLSRREG
jgi:hypothetical protein